jgi:hypothetical protein
MSKTTKYLLFGGAAVVLVLILRSGSTGLTIPGITPAPVSTTAANVTAAGTAAGSILGGLSSLFNGPTTAALTSGASPSNPNDISSSAQESNADVDNLFTGFSSLDD